MGWAGSCRTTRRSTRPASDSAFSARVIAPRADLRQSGRPQLSDKRPSPDSSSAATIGIDHLFSPRRVRLAGQSERTSAGCRPAPALAPAPGSATVLGTHRMAVAGVAGHQPLPRPAIQRAPHDSRPMAEAAGKFHERGAPLPPGRAPRQRSTPTSGGETGWGVGPARLNMKVILV